MSAIDGYVGEVLFDEEEQQDGNAGGVNFESGEEMSYWRRVQV